MSLVPDVLVLSLGTTRGWRVADQLFLEQLQEAGASAVAVSVRMGLAGRLRRAYPVNDLVEATAARRALRAALAAHRPRAVVLSTVTATMLAPSVGVPCAVRLDTPAALNRRGLRNRPLHLLERRGLARADLVLPWSQAALDAMPPVAAPAVMLPPPVVPSGPHASERERLAVAYVPDPKAKGLDLLCLAWAEAAVEDARLEVFGIAPTRALRHLRRTGVSEPTGIVWRGMVPLAEFRAALRRARTMVAAARWEDFGQAPLEALADGALLVTSPSPGAFDALPLARTLKPELVAPDMTPGALAACLRRAFALGEESAREYRAAAAERLAPYRSEALVSRVRDEVLPRLLRA